MSDWEASAVRPLALEAFGERYRRYRLCDPAAEEAIARSNALGDGRAGTCVHSPSKDNGAVESHAEALDRRSIALDTEVGPVGPREVVTPEGQPSEKSGDSSPRRSTSRLHSSLQLTFLAAVAQPRPAPRLAAKMVKCLAAININQSPPLPGSLNF